MYDTHGSVAPVAQMIYSKQYIEECNFLPMKVESPEYLTS